MNAGIEGLVADIFKIRSCASTDALIAYRARLILQVHDEVIVELPADEREELVERTRHASAHAAELRDRRSEPRRRLVLGAAKADGPAHGDRGAARSLTFPG